MQANFSAQSTTKHAVLPGTRDSLLVVNSGIVTVYDAGVPRANAASAESTLITATYSPHLAYGFNSGDTGYDFTTYCINARGVFAQRSEGNIFRGGPLLFDANIVYGGNAAYDIQKQRVIGTYSGTYGIAVDTSNRRLFTASSWPDKERISAYDLDTFAFLDTDSAYPSNSFRGSALVRWGRYGFAFLHSRESYGTATLYIGKSTLIP